jgi:hypothetical protein
MQASYLRVKNHAKFQHYDPAKRRTPWIKLYNNLLGGEVGGFENLPEAEQWQLVRIWLVASKSTSLTYDEKGVVVPVVSHDEKSLRRSIMSLKRIPLEKFIREGWLIPVSEDELIPPENASGGDSKDASNDSRRDSKHPPDLPPSPPTNASPLLEVEGREVENLVPKLKGSPRPLRQVPSLPVNDHLLDRLLTLCAASSDDGTERVFRSYAEQLPESSLAKVVETTAKKPTADRARYANGALRSEIEERSAA